MSEWAAQYLADGALSVAACVALGFASRWAIRRVERQVTSARRRR